MNAPRLYEVLNPGMHWDNAGTEQRKMFRRLWEEITTDALGSFATLGYDIDDSIVTIKQVMKVLEMIEMKETTNPSDSFTLFNLQIELSFILKTLERTKRVFLEGDL